MAKEKEEPKAEEPVAPKPKSKKKLLIIVAVVVMLAGGAGAFAFMGGKEPSPEGEVTEEQHTDEEKHYSTFEIDTLIVNLSENASFIKVSMTVEYDPSIIDRAGSTGHGGGGAYGGGASGGKTEAGGMPAVVQAREPMIKDAIIKVLSSKTPAEVLTVAGKEQLKEELIEAMNEATGLDEGPIVNIYFREFIVQ